MAKLKIPKASAVVRSARVRRDIRRGEQAVRIEWFIKNVSNTITMTMRQRMRIAVGLLRNRVVRNISRPVTKSPGKRWSTVTRWSSAGRSGAKVGKEGRTRGTVVSNRSKPGEYPKVETAQLMRSIFHVVMERVPGVIDGAVGTPLDYGLILETRMNRSFLVRSLKEVLPSIRRLLAGPIKGQRRK